MLLAALLAPLLGDASAAPPEVDLLRLPPGDVVALAHVRDVHGLMARHETSTWAKFLADPAWNRVVAAARDASPGGDAASAARTEAVVAEVAAAMRDVRSAVAFVSGSPLGPAPVFVFAALAGDALGAPLTRLMRGAAPTREGELVVTAADGGVFEAYFRRGDLHIVVDAPDAATAVAFGRAALERLDAAAPRAGRAAAFDAVSDAEFDFDLRALWAAALTDEEVPMEALPFLTAIASVEWLHGRLRIGEGEDMQLAVEAPYRDEGIARALMGAFRPCDPTLLGLAPSVAISASVGNADLTALLDVVLAEIGANAPEQRAELDAALQAIAEAVGIDVRGELLAALAGDYVTFSLPIDMSAAAEATTTDARLSALDASCTAFRIRDPEPFLTAIETALDVAGGAGLALESTTLRGAEVWATELEGRYVGLAVHPEYVCLAMDPDALHAFLSRVNGDDDAPTSFLARPEYAAAARELAGTYVSLSPTRSTLAFTGNLLEVLGMTLARQMGASDPDGARLGRVVIEAGKVTALLGQRHFKGILRGRLVIEGGRIRSLTEAR